MKRVPNAILKIYLPRHRFWICFGRLAKLHDMIKDPMSNLLSIKIISGSLLLGNTVWAQREHAVYINAGQEKVQCFPDDMTSGLIGESSLKVMTGLF